MTTLAIYWFRQDLRLTDNPALSAAAEKGKILPIYILDDINSHEYKMGGASRVWLHHSLTSLNESLGRNLLVFSGNPLEILEQLIKDYNISEVFWNRCYEPWQIARDTKIKENLENLDIQVNSYNGSLLWEPWQIQKDDKTPYKIFTPYYKKSLEQELHKRYTTPAPDNIKYIVPNIKTDISNLQLLPTRQWGGKIASHWQIGELAAQEKLKEFIANKVIGYKEGRNFPSKNNCSNLSPHLHFGEISPNQIFYELQNRQKDIDVAHFLSELGWREFSYYLLYHFPELPDKNLKSNFDGFPWEDNLELLTKWQKGETGYPIIDAGMKELYQTGTMHNRVRMIAASFLVKNLLIHWKHGERWFWDCLFDADLANNSASWQWVAGCGTDAAPYFRIFNPVTQGAKFDPKGEYIKKYLPQLRDLPTPHLFSPWEAPTMILQGAGVELGKNYPKPIIDIKKSRDKALAAYEQTKS